MDEVVVCAQKVEAGAWRGERPGRTARRRLRPLGRAVVVGDAEDYADAGGLGQLLLPTSVGESEGQEIQGQED